MHEPPHGTLLAAESGVIAGNRQWMDAIKAHLPRLVVFGHDHNTPKRNKIWQHRLASGTVCVNVGQDSQLRYALIEMTFADDRPSLPKRIEVRVASETLILS